MTLPRRRIRKPDRPGRPPGADFDARLLRYGKSLVKADVPNERRMSPVNASTTAVPEVRAVPLSRTSGILPDTEPCRNIPLENTQAAADAAPFGGVPPGDRVDGS